MDAPAGMDQLRIEVTELSQVDVQSPVYQPHASLEGERYFKTTFPNRDNSIDMPLFAFHSVKGGVGRTTSALAFAVDQQPGESSQPTLLVDADFEAPGISFLLQSRKANSTISFEDLIALAHADRSVDFSATLDFVAERMADQRVDNLFILPAKRTLSDLSGFAIRPENLLAARRDDPYVVVDLIRSLAKRLGCRKAVVDLRAGLVDVAVQFLSDPTVERVLVSTVSGQSISALQSMIRTLGNIEKESGTLCRLPLVVFNQLPIYRLTDPEFRGMLIRSALSALPPSNTLADDTAESPLSFAFVSHLSDLVASSGDWDSFLRDLSASSFSKSLSIQVGEWAGIEQLCGVTASGAEGAENTEFSNVGLQRRELQEFAEKLEVAETAKLIGQPLATPPLQRLVSDFLSQPPIVVVEGAKGTGKTLTARYLLGCETWSKAVNSMVPTAETNFSGPLLPFFGSVASNDTLLQLIVSGRQSLAKALGATKAPSSVTATEQSIKDRLEAGPGAESWLNFWLREIAKAAGFYEPDGWAAMVEAARSSSIKPIILIEGLEEVLTDPFVNSEHRAALLTLLREVPLHLREEAGRPIGYIAFMRGDMVEATLIQNLAQFRAGYASYALNWRDRDIKELVVWLAANSGALPGLWTPEWRNETLEKQEADLRKIWGLKLGSDDSREARSTEWVIAVLTDLTGKLTARDLVRFIGAAAKSSREIEEKTDRLLAAIALKKAVEHTSRAKIEEYPKEVRQLGPIFGKLILNPGFETPFDRIKASEIGISDTELEALETFGVAYQENGIFEVPELFRLGLHMKRAGARPNIISLTRRARERAKS
ncbi:KGGVGR-motif variant AAA ATPase [Gluconobacter oxydans]|uniref:AAA domain-containing protein n=1 Tax=Gluconobacter oxydans TaxID=442 RepID=A0AB35ANN7_GLUOY|nr:hypothetical protein [Gluconobacter oxydans]MBF0856536.1 hypothetical protein [Gluconobacter oxydans]